MDVCLIKIDLSPFYEYLIRYPATPFLKLIPFRLTYVFTKKKRINVSMKKKFINIAGKYISSGNVGFPFTAQQDLNKKIKGLEEPWKKNPTWCL